MSRWYLRWLVLPRWVSRLALKDPYPARRQDQKSSPKNVYIQLRSRASTQTKCGTKGHRSLLTSRELYPESFIMSNAAAEPCSGDTTDTTGHVSDTTNDVSPLLFLPQDGTNGRSRPRNVCQWGDNPECASTGAAHGHADRNLVSFGDDVVDVATDVGADVV